MILPIYLATTFYLLLYKCTFTIKRILSSAVYRLHHYFMNRRSDSSKFSTEEIQSGLSRDSRYSLIGRIAWLLRSLIFSKMSARFVRDSQDQCCNMPFEAQNNKKNYHTFKYLKVYII